MLNKNGLKIVGSFAKNVLEVVGPVVVGQILLGKLSTSKYVATYNNAIDIVMKSNIWSGDKVKIVSAIKTDANTEYYAAVIRIAKSSLVSTDKVNLILEMCKCAEEA